MGNAKESSAPLGPAELAATVEQAASTIVRPDPDLRTDSLKLAPSTRIGRYAILRQLGQGGMGVVYAAYDEELDRKVAVKVLRNGEAADHERRMRILREAQAMARVSHPNVVNVYEVGEVGGQIFIAMEYVDGTTLGQWQQSERSWDQVLRMYRDAGAGLLAAHRAGLVHRDFKPDNVLVGRDGRPRVADFGLARSGTPETPAAREDAETRIQPADTSGAPLQSPLTLAGAILGTPAYMSPEQHRGEPTDGRSDQFSFCAALYEALYKKPPFAGDTLLALSFNVLRGKLRPVPHPSPVPAQIERALRRGLATTPAQRFASMQELLAALDIDLHRDPAAAPLARRLYSVAFVATLLVNLAILDVAWLRGTLSVRKSLYANVIIFIAALSLAFWQRKTLLKNAFHRGIISAVLIMLGQMLVTRGLADVLHFNMEQVLALDMILVTGLCTHTALFYLWGAWGLVAVCLLGSLATYFNPTLSIVSATIIFPVVAIAFVILWGRAAREQRGRFSKTQFRDQRS